VQGHQNNKRVEVLQTQEQMSGDVYRKQRGPGWACEIRVVVHGDIRRAHADRLTGRRFSVYTPQTGDGTPLASRVCARGRSSPRVPLCALHTPAALVSGFARLALAYFHGRVMLATASW
jgi:hypothetical protein